MKKNLSLRLCLILIVAITAYSCRTDQFPEAQSFINDSSKFQLTSKRISLDESKHRSILLPELEKAKVGINAFSKTNVNGRVIDYGNGVSIDTDEVTFIENGPNYHTYTFTIKRENAPADAPVENLVLSPLTDGTYRELLFSYNLTPQEKQTLTNGGFVNTENKVTVIDLQKGTFNSGGELAKNSVCTWTIETKYTTCSQKKHSNGEPAGDGTNGTCAAETTSQLVVMVVGDCKALGDDGEGGGSSPGSTPPPTSPGTGGGLGSGEDDGSGNNEFPSNEPGDCGGGLTAPQTPNYDISDGGCGSGIPTQPTLPLVKSKTPCAKIKAQRADTDFNNKITDLQGKTGLKKETGYIQRTNGEYTYKDNASATDQANELALPKADLPENQDIISYFHTHVNDYWYTDANGEYRPKQGIKIFSPADINYFMKMIKNAQDAGRPLGDIYAIMVTSKGSYQLRFTGNQYQIKIFTDSQITAHRDPFSKFMTYKREKPKDLEFGILKYMEDNMNLKGVTLYRMNSDGTNTEIKLNVTKTDREEINCPN